MARETRAPVLILGGTGAVGSRTAKILRQLYPDLPIAIGTRNPDKARALAQELGNSAAVKVDLEREDLGLAQNASFSAVVVSLKDNTLNSLKYAQSKGLPSVSFSDGVFEISPGVVTYAYKPTRAPVLLGSHWAAGAATLPALQLASQFRAVRTIEVVVIMDPEDAVGPMAIADVEQLQKASPYPLVLDKGHWRWVGDDIANRRVKTAQGKEVDARAMSVLDTLSLAVATGAHSARTDLAVAPTGPGQDGSRLHEIVVEMEGEQRDGKSGRLRLDILAPQGVTGLTALGVVLNVERLLGLAGGAAVAPGLYLPELLIDPAYAVRRLTEFGVQIRRS